MSAGSSEPQCSWAQNLPVAPPPVWTSSAWEGTAMLGTDGLISVNYPVECVWLIAGLQPHLARVRLIRLWGTHLWYMNKQCTQDKQAINTHTQRRATVMTAHYTCLACTILPSPIDWIDSPNNNLSCIGGAQKSQVGLLLQIPSCTKCKYHQALVVDNKIPVI